MQAAKLGRRAGAPASEVVGCSAIKERGRVENGSLAMETLTESRRFSKIVTKIKMSISFPLTNIPLTYTWLLETRSDL